MLRHMAIGLAASAMLFAIASDALADDAPRAAICKTAEETGYTADIRNCLGLKYEAADKRLNAVYKTKMASLDAPGRRDCATTSAAGSRRGTRSVPNRGSPMRAARSAVEVDSCFVNETERRIKVIDAFR